jgi:hypothetical protein
MRYSRQWRISRETPLIITLTKRPGIIPFSYELLAEMKARLYDDGCEELNDDLEYIEFDEEPDLPDWMMDEVDLALEILLDAGGRYVRIPERDSATAFNSMRAFTETVEIPGKLSYQTYRQPIIINFTIKRNSSGTYYLANSSVTGYTIMRNGTGNLQINVDPTSPFNNTNYIVQATGIYEDNVIDGGVPLSIGIGYKKTSSFVLIVTRSSSSLTDITSDNNGYIDVVIYFT